MKYNLENNSTFSKLITKYNTAEHDFESAAPGCVEWYTVLVSVIANDFKNNISILDYGCGNGALAYFLTKVLDNFTYYGLEPLNSPSLLKNNKKLRQNKMVNLKFITDDNLKIAIDNTRFAILGSVFTHLEWKDSCDILDKLVPIIKNGGKIIFSCFLNNKYILYDNQHYEYVKINTYHKVHITTTMIEDYCLKNSIKMTLTKSWYESRPNDNPHVKHSIIVLHA